jgi:hypothetical protein
MDIAVNFTYFSNQAYISSIGGGGPEKSTLDSVVPRLRQALGGGPLKSRDAICSPVRVSKIVIE